MRNCRSEWIQRAALSRRMRSPGTPCRGARARVISREFRRCGEIVCRERRGQALAQATIVELRADELHIIDQHHHPESIATRTRCGFARRTPGGAR